MSPLARSLLALACAALLRLRPASARYSSDLCSTIIMGKEKITIEARRTEGPFSIKPGIVELPKAPYKEGLKLGTAIISVCAEFGHFLPIVIPLKVFSSMEVMVLPWRGVHPPLEMTVRQYYTSDEDLDTSS